MDDSKISDEMLTAFLDGESDPALAKQIADALVKDPALARRIEALEIPKSTIRQAFDRAMQAAPLERFEATLETPPPGRNVNGIRQGKRTMVQIAAAAAIMAFALGIAAGRFSWQRPTGDEDWRVAVAEYQALYSPATLESIAPNAAESDHAIQRVATEVGAPIAPSLLKSLEHVSFKRAQILRWRDAPLAQFAFLTHGGIPLAFCATPTREANQSIDHQVLKGLASSSWVVDGMAYMVIGGEDPVLVNAIAEQLRGAI